MSKYASAFPQDPYQSPSRTSTPGPSHSIRTNGTSSPGPVMNDDYGSVIEGLKKIYSNKIRPLEVTYNFEGFHSSPLTDSDISAKPIVLLVGQYSTGKTTFIRHIIRSSYPGEHIGVEPTTDRFIAVMNSPTSEPRVIPGNAAAVNIELPFRGLDKFGQAFLSRFQVSQVPCAGLENMTIIDTPGVLSGDKQRIARGYEFTSVIEWFAERADLVLLLFDSHKLDISDEFKAAILALKGMEEKVRVVLNKSDMISQQQLMRVYGALMWSLGKVVQTPEVMRVYLGSFWVEKPVNAFDDCRELINAEQEDLLRELRDLPRNAAIRKINEIVKRARIAKVHAYIVSHLKKEMPSLFNKQKKQEELIRNLDKEFLKIQQRHHLPSGDFPNVDRFRQNLRFYKFDEFKSLKDDQFERVDEALSRDLPKLMARFPQTNPIILPLDRNPFDHPPTMRTSDLPPDYWSYNSIDMTTYSARFRALNPVHGKLPGVIIKSVLEETGLSQDALAQVWRLADWDGDGYMDIEQFAVAMHIARGVQQGAPVPDRLPEGLRGPF